MDNLLGIVPWVFTIVILALSFYASTRQQSQNGHITKAAREVADAAGDVADAAGSTVTSMRSYIEVLQAQLTAAGGAPVSQGQAEALYRIAGVMTEVYTAEEIRLLAVSIGLDDELIGDSRMAKAVNLLITARNRAALSRLINRMKGERPNAPWPV